MIQARLKESSKNGRPMYSVTVEEDSRQVTLHIGNKAAAYKVCKAIAEAVNFIEELEVKG